jgi:HTH-type transcriptional repressor of NAD biosynthesis genes
VVFVEGEKQTAGLIIGKFMPPHKGHKHLIDFARQRVDKLTVLVCSLKSEPMLGELRYGWMREMFPEVNVLHVTDENPSEPHQHPDFWRIWHDTIYRALPQGADYLFAGEDYGIKLAEVLGMKFVPLERGREKVKISATQIREAPMKYWDYILPKARPYFAKKVCIFGPESTGKSTLAEKLAEHYNTVFVPEYARDYLRKNKDEQCYYDDISRIAKGHMASEDALVKKANRILFCDTDLITTVMWSKVLFGKCPEWIENEADNRQYDLYLLTDIDVPWIEDKQRYLPNQRKEFLDMCIRELEKRGRKYVLINGSWNGRLEKAIQEIDKLIGNYKL